MPQYYQHRYLIYTLPLWLGMFFYASNLAWANVEIKAEDQKNGAIIATTPPAGFEEMVEPEKNLIDVFYGGIKLGSFEAVYDLKTVKFKYPKKIVKKIPHINDKDRASILKALQKELKTNVLAQCPKEIISQKISCGSIQPKDAGIIYYDDTFKADLFVNPSYLDLQDTRLGVKLPKGEKGFSGIHSFNATMSSTNWQDQNVTLLHNSLLSVGQTRLGFSSITTQDNVFLDNMNISTDKHGFLQKLGLFETGHLQTVPQVRLGGVSFETSFDTNMDLKRTSGNQLTIYLPKRAWVTLQRGEVVYSSDFYEAGNQILDTSQLPDGAYEITLKINDSSGIIREEKRFYAKNFNIPPSNIPIYYLQTGVLRDDTTQQTMPQLTEKPVAVLGTTRRISKFLGVNLGTMLTEKKQFLESTFYAIMPKNHQISVGGMATPDKDLGVSASYIGTFLKDRAGLSGNVRKIWQGETNNNSNPLDIVYQPIDTWQASAAASYQATDKLSLNFQYNQSSSANAPKTFAYGPYIRYNLWQTGQKSVMLFADANKSDQGKNGSVYARFTYGLGNWSVNADSGTRWRRDNTPNASDGNNPYANARLAWADSSRQDRYLAAGVDMNKDQTTESRHADFDYRSQLGRMKLDLIQNKNNGQDTTIGLGSVGFNILHGGKKVSIGGDREERSGMIVYAPTSKKQGKKDKNIAAKVFVNGSERGIVKSGSKLPLVLTPYETYQITAQPVNSDKPIEVTTTNKPITLYPGNVIPISLDVKRVFILLGQLVNSKKEPIANAKLKRARSLVTTDEDGRFQAEVLESKQLIFTYRDVIKKLPTVDLNAQIPNSSSADNDLEPLDLKAVNADVTTVDLQNNIAAKTLEKATNTIKDTSVSKSDTDQAIIAALEETQTAPTANAKQDNQETKDNTEKLAANNENLTKATDKIDAIDSKKIDTAPDVKSKKHHKKTTINKPANPNKQLLENTPQWVKDAENGTQKLGKKHTCIVTLPSANERHGVIIYKKPLVCVDQ